MARFFIISLILFYFCFISIKGSGDFWFITDFHVDQNYSRTGNPQKLCHSEGKVFPDNGLYGNFLCDSPLILVTATINSMKAIQPKPDFIIWTGDNLPHTHHSLKAEWNVVFEGIRNISDLLSVTFPNVTIFPSIGNHDTFPPNILLPNSSSEGIYDGYLEQGGWNKFLSKEAVETFKQGGFYTELIQPGLRIINLNTILWYFSNPHVKELTDPAGQFRWLNETLANSSELSEKVYIVSHVPPGYYNRVNPGTKSDPTLHPHFLIKFLEILHQYSDIILGQMYGHVHMDMFELFKFGTSEYKSSALLAGSVTPWHYINMQYNITLPVNPSIRLMHFSPKDFILKDYDQYFLNLTKVNAVNKDKSDNLYEHLYTFTEAYGVPDISTKSLVQVYEMLNKNETVYNTFFKYLTSGKESDQCEEHCKTSQLCSMSGTSADEYNLCMDGDDCCSGKTGTIIVLVFITLLILLVIAYMVSNNFNIFRRKSERLY